MGLISRIGVGFWKFIFSVPESRKIVVKYGVLVFRFLKFFKKRGLIFGLRVVFSNFIFGVPESRKKAVKFCLVVFRIF